jgi:3-hydroxyisobutyrate dehydrogenase-like beta-hydroxyacid dehydrogenase
MQGTQLQTTAKIGFVGLGHMGGAMVGRLLQGGHTPSARARAASSQHARTTSG